MATSFFTYVLFSILFTSTLVKGDLVTDVCIKTPVLSLCEKLLRSDPRSKTADLETLGTIAFNMTSDLITSTSTMVEFLYDNATSTAMRELFRFCSSYYAYVEVCTENAIGYYKDKNYGQLVNFMTKSIDEVRLCDKSLRYKDENKNLKQASLSLQQYFIAIIVIAIRL